MPNTPTLHAVDIDGVFQKLSKILSLTSESMIDEFEVISFVFESRAWNGENVLPPGHNTIYDFTSHNNSRSRPIADDDELIMESIRIACTELKPLLSPFLKNDRHGDMRITKDTLYFTVGEFSSL